MACIRMEAASSVGPETRVGGKPAASRLPNFRANGWRGESLMDCLTDLTDGPASGRRDPSDRMGRRVASARTDGEVDQDARDEASDDLEPVALVGALHERE